MLGVVAVVTAGLGSVATAGESGGPVAGTSPAYESTGSSTSSATPSRATGDGIDVSRSFDRPTLERQTALQTRQRDRALEQNDRDVAARASDLEEAADRRDRLAEQRRRQWVLPVAGYTLTATFGQQSSRWSSGMHTGLDFAGPSGTEVLAMAAGTVTFAGYSGAYGNRTVITLEDGMEISYAHQSRIVVQVGDEVLPGQLTGYTGATGNVTGPHLHLEVERPGSGPIDPAPVLRSHGIDP